MSLFHITHLQAALRLAQSRRGWCAPNPAVGAIIVKDHTVLAQGRHWAAGHPHAEVDALQALGEHAAQGATLYVTLEPCCHWGKTPPCTQRIIQAGIQRVYYAFRDPNPKVAGKGIQELRAAGILCEHIELPEINDFYKSYTYWWKHQRPWATLKLAMSLDAKIAAVNHQPVAITGPELAIFTHQQRYHSDAILTTINTILRDDPQFNVRWQGETIKKPVYVLDSNLRLPVQATVLHSTQSLTLLHSRAADKTRRQALMAAGVQCMPIGKTKAGLDLVEVFNILGKAGIHDVWIEVGAHGFHALLQQRLIQRIFIYIAPKLLGSQALSAFMDEGAWLHSATSIHWQVYGKDIVCKIDLNE